MNDDQFEAHIKTTAWYGVLSQAAKDDDDGASVFRMARMAAREAWNAPQAMVEQQAEQIAKLEGDVNALRWELRDARKGATVAPAVDAQPVWISVDEQMPNEGQSVAFVVSSASPTFAYLNGRVLGGYFGHVARHPTFSVPGLGLHASHWMPLPAAPAAAANGEQEARNADQA